MTQPATASGRKGRVPARLIAAQSRSSVGALVVSAVVVAVAVFAAAAVPVLASKVATDEARVAVTNAGPRADVVVDVPLGRSGWSILELVPDTVESAHYVRDRLQEGMPPELAQVLGEPIITFASMELKMGAIDGLPARARFAYVEQEGGPWLSWVEGAAPQATQSATEVLDNQIKATIEVGVSEATAAALGVGVGDTLPVVDPDEGALDVVITGVFRPESGVTPLTTVPTLIEPRVSHGAAGQISVGLLTSEGSLPAARLGAFPSTMQRYFTYRVDPEQLTAANVHSVETAAKGLASGKQVFEVVAEEPRVITGLDRVLGTALDRAAAGTAQAAALLLGVLAGVALTQVLGATVLVNRRARVIAQLGERGAPAIRVGTSLAVESVVIAALGTVIGLAAQQAIAPGPVPWSWVAVPVLVAVLAGPLLGVRAVRRRAAPPPAMSRRRGPLSAGAARRITGFVAVAGAATVALFALRARGTAASQGAVAADLLVLAAPVLCAATAGIVLAWALPYVSRALRSLTARGRSAAPLIAASRTRADVITTVSLVVAAAVLALSVSASATLRQGLTDAAWDAVGADVVAVAAPGGAIAEDALASADGVAVAAAADLGVGQLAGGRRSQTVHVVAVDAADLARVAALTPGGHADRWQALADAPLGDQGEVPMLESAKLEQVGSGTLVWGEYSAPVKAVGKAPDVPGTATDSGSIAADAVVVVDRATVAAAAGEAIPATIVWCVGPDAEESVSAALAESGATVTTRESWRADVTASPVTSALVALFGAAAVAALVLVCLATGMTVAGGARERSRSAGRLRLAGLSRREVGRALRAEVALPATICTLVGAAVGLALLWSLAGSLGLQAITQQSRAPNPVLEWWTLAVPLVVGAFAWVAVAIAQRTGRAPRLGEVMRSE